jgi:hypothetical protein
MARRKNPAAVALAKRRLKAMTPEQRQEVARAGGKVGGRARAAKLSKAERTRIASKAGAARTQAMTPEQRSQIARKAVEARWAKAKKKTKRNRNSES